MSAKKITYIIYDNLKTLIGALIIAILIRSLLFQPFYIPSSSMEPTLLVGDRIFVSKYKYGYSKHSFPFSPNISNDRFFSKSPNRGDLVVFKTPADNRTDYIKRLIGMPGDTVQFVNGELLINENKILRKKVEHKKIIRCGNFLLETNTFIETLPNGLKHFTRSPMATSMDADFDTGNSRYKARERYSFGVSDPLGIFGSPGA